MKEKPRVTGAVLFVGSAITLGLLTAVHARYVYAHQLAGADFLDTVWSPSRDVIHGVSPFADPRVPGFKPWADYPPSAFLPLLPVAALSHGGAILFSHALTLSAVVATVWLLGLRDWRCLLLVPLLPPVHHAVLLGNMTALLVPLLALVWLWRDQPRDCGLALAACIAIKLFLLPVIIWLIFTRRLRASVVAVTAAPAAIILAWLAIGFDGFRDYPQLLARASDLWQKNTPFVQGLVLQVGGARVLASVLGLTMSGCLLLLAWRLRRVDELGSFASVITAAILASPIAWNMYLGLLLVPFVVRHRRFGRAWALLSILWIYWSLSPLEGGTVAVSIATIICAGGMLTGSLLMPWRLRQAEETLVGQPAVA